MIPEITSGGLLPHSFHQQPPTDDTGSSSNCWVMGPPFRGGPITHNETSVFDSQHQPITFRVLNDPVPEPRPRFSRATGRIYIPKTAHAWKFAVRAAAAEHFIRPYAAKLPLGVAVEFFVRRPKSHLRTGRNSGLIRNTAPRSHVSTPDTDNLLKSTIDAVGDWKPHKEKLAPICWHNDSQLIIKLGWKRYATKDNPPGARITIWQPGEAAW